MMFPAHTSGLRNGNSCASWHSLKLRQGAGIIIAPSNTRNESVLAGLCSVDGHFGGPQ